MNASDLVLERLRQSQPPPPAHWPEIAKTFLSYMGEARERDGSYRATRVCRLRRDRRTLTREQWHAWRSCDRRWFRWLREYRRWQDEPNRDERRHVGKRDRKRRKAQRQARRVQRR